MYHPKVIADSVTKMERALGLDLRSYSFSEVEGFEHRLREVTWEPGLDTVLATQPEDVQAYILNELALSQCDWRYWSERYCKISNDAGVIVPVRLWPSQEKVFELVQQQELKAFIDWQDGAKLSMQAKIWIIIAKARQLGLTVIGEDLVAHLTLLFSNTRSIIASDDIRTNSPKLYRVFNMMYNNMPKWMQPPCTANVKAVNMHFGAIESDLVVSGGNQKNTMGQGMTIDAVHLTEMSTWRDDVARGIEEDLKPAFKSSKKHHSIFIIESTGKGGKGNYFYDQWDACVKGVGHLAPIFIGWHSCPEKYERRDDGIVIGDDVLSLARRLKEEQNVTLTKEQLCWYQFEKRAAEATGDLQIFLQEYPSSAEEAFQFGLRSVFPIEVRNKIRNEVRRPLAVYDINWAARRLKVEPMGDRSPIEYQQQGRGLDVDEWLNSADDSKADNRLIIWEMPKRGYVYTVGMDVSYGHDGMDNSAIQVVRVGNRWAEDEQVAEWSGNRNPAELDIPAWIMGNLYVDAYEGVPAKMAIETNEGSPGILVQTKLLERGYGNFYVTRRRDRIGGGYTKSIGWHTNVSTREPLIHMGVDAVKKGILTLNSTGTLKEMDTFVVTMTTEGKRKIEHAPRYHDDRLIALFIAYSAAHDGDTSVVADERARFYERMKQPTEKKVRQYQLLPVSAEQVNEMWEQSMDNYGGL